MPVSPSVFTQEEAALYLGTSRDTVRRAVQGGIIPASRVGRRWFISKAVLDSWLAGEQVGPATSNVPARQRNKA